MKNPENPIANPVLAALQTSGAGFRQAWKYQQENELFPSAIKLAQDLFILGILPLFALPDLALKVVCLWAASKFGRKTTAAPTDKN